MYIIWTWEVVRQTFRAQLANLQSILEKAAFNAEKMEWLLFAPKNKFKTEFMTKLEKVQFGRSVDDIRMCKLSDIRRLLFNNYWRNWSIIL